MNNNQKTKKLVNNEFIILEYLLKETSANDPKKYIDYIEFAKSKYGVSFDPRTVATTLESFYQLSKENVEYFPFKIEAKGNKARKYYCSKLLMNYDLVEKYIQTIRKSSSLVKSEKELMISILLSSVASKDIREKYNDPVKYIRTVFLNPENKLNTLKEYKEKDYGFYYKVVAPQDCFSELDIKKEDEFLGSVYGIYDVNNQMYLALLTLNHKYPMIMPIDAIQLLNKAPVKKEDNQEGFSISNDWSIYESMDEFCNAYFSHTTTRKFDETILGGASLRFHDTFTLTFNDDLYEINKTLRLLNERYPNSTIAYDKTSKSVSIESDIDYFMETYRHILFSDSNPVVDIKPEYIKKAIVMSLEFEANKLK